MSADGVLVDRQPASRSLTGSSGRLRRLVRVLRAHPTVLVGASVVILFVILAVGADLIAPFDPTLLRAGPPLLGPGPEHPLGTDQLGRDLFSRVVHGSRISLAVGSAAMLFAVVIGVPLGLVSGYAGGRWDLLIMRGVDVLLAFPFLILALLLIVVLGNGTINVVWALGVVSIPAFARIVRSRVLALKEREFVQAARLLGATTPRLLFRHILPNSLSPVIITASLLIAVAIVAEASLSYLGMGTQPPTASWGYDLNASITYLEVNPWMAIGPGLAILITAVGFNLLGDGLRDILDPRLGRGG